jgi:RNA polymerase sigma-70 factor (ECF subfamily)
MKGGTDNIAELVALYQKWYADLVRYLHRLLQDSSGLAEDIAQDAFVIMLRKWQEVSNHPCPKAWLYKVARRLAIRTLKERSREYLKAEVPDRVSAWEDDPSDSYNITMTVREALSKLTKRQREAVELFYFEDFKQNDIAAIMQIQRSTVAVLLSQARKRLAELTGWLPEEGQDS